MHCFMTENWLGAKCADGIFTDQFIYSQTCIKRPPLGHRKSGFIRQVTSWKRFNSYEIDYGRTRKRWPFNTGDCMDRFDYIFLYIFALFFVLTRDIFLFAYLNNNTFLFFLFFNKDDYSFMVWSKVMINSRKINVLIMRLKIKGYYYGNEKVKCQKMTIDINE